METREASNKEASLPLPIYLSATRREGWTAFVVLQIALIVASIFLPSRQLEWFTCQLMFGIVVAQCALAGVWLMLGPGWLMVRIPCAPLWLLAATGAGGIWDRPGEAFWVMLACGGTLTLAIVGVVGIARLAIHVRLSHATDSVEQRPFQYSLKHLLILISLTSVLLAAGRLFAGTVSEGGISRSLLMFIPIGIAWSFAILPIVFVAFAARSQINLLLGMGVGTLFAIGVLLAGGWMMWQMQVIPRDTLVATVAVGFIGYLGTLIGLLLQRRIGYRLVR